MALCDFMVELRPALPMFFRPEEVHGTSGEGDIGQPFYKRHRYVADNFSRFLLLYFAVTYIDTDRFAAIRARRFDVDCFSGKKPADRQRFEGSLAEPLLPAIDRNPILCWKVVERCERYDQIATRVEPAGNPGLE